MHRFFAPALDPGDEVVVLPKDEGEHLTRVLRLGVGDTVSVFDGRGHEFLARVAGVVRRDVSVQILSRVAPAAEPSVALTLAQAVLKGDKMDEVVRDAVMLGVTTIQPLMTKRTEMAAGAQTRAARVDRWRRVALASVKQSRRAVLPDVRIPLPLDSYLDDPSTGLRLMLVEPSATLEVDAAAVAVEPLSVLRGLPTPPEAALLVGPEGGWTREETMLAAARGVRLLTLGDRTLRADAVPVAAISVLQFLWEP